MAVVNTKSNAITNADATPQVRSSRILVGAPALAVNGFVSVASGDDDGSVYRMFRIRSNSVIHSLTVRCTAITAGTSYTIGLYDTAANGGAAVSAALFATALDLSTAITLGTSVLFQNNTITNIEKRIFELLSLATDPAKEYDLVLVGTTVGSANGTIAMSMIYSV